MIDPITELISLNLNLLNVDTPTHYRHTFLTDHRMTLLWKILNYSWLKTKYDWAKFSFNISFFNILKLFDGFSPLYLNPPMS